MGFLIRDGRVFEIGTWSCEESYGTEHCSCCDPGDVIGWWYDKKEGDVVLPAREAAETFLMWQALYGGSL
jgi:hypothetical protein